MHPHNLVLGKPLNFNNHREIENKIYNEIPYYLNFDKNLLLKNLKPNNNNIQTKEILDAPNHCTTKIQIKKTFDLIAVQNQWFSIKQIDI